MKKIIILWRDIPSQIIYQQGRLREKGLLSQRFQDAIDRAAMRAGKGSSSEYLADWRRIYEPCDEALNIKDSLANDLKKIETEYSDQRLLQLIRQHGKESGE